MDSLIKLYRRSLEELNYSINTINLYEKDILEFKDFLKFDLRFAKREDVLQYLYFINEKGNKTRTKRHKIFALKSFYKWLRLKNNPTLGINPVKIAPRHPKYLSLEDALKLQNIYNEENCRNPQKNNLIIRIFLSTGLRISEVCNFKLEDMSNSQINVVTKGNKQRVVYFTNQIQNSLKSYCREFKPEVYLFESKKGKQYSRRGMHQIIANAFKIAGIEGMSAHSLRHTTATIMYESTKDILLVKEFLGHKSIESTMIYTHISERELRDAVSRNPLNRRYR